MLVMTPEAKAMLRKERRRVADARRGKLGEDRHRALIDKLAKIIRAEREAGRIAVAFNLEGPLRHAVRAMLCREGWRWADADQIARNLLDATFNRLGAHRPPWNEGQPEWAIHAGTLIERTQCVRCRKPLPEGHFRFCSALCGSAHNNMQAAIKEANEVSAYDKVVNFRGVVYDYEP